ncbi:hypothetical protein ACFC58_36260 [Kitasatospora purpeofusca]|uniref:hypothetical protein n=1 Tax=Kitasatospora purpeofusca TaxID=67352 RepID=UPI0035DDB94F
MRHPFRHPLASVAAGTVLGHRRDGRPIYPIAGGNGEGEGGSGTGGSGDGGQGDGQQGGTAGTGGSTDTGGDATDWKAMARQWEKRAKENGKAQEELEKLRKASLSEQEKAVETARTEGRTAAAQEYGTQLAAARFDAALARAGLQLGDAADLIDTTKFVTDTGDVDTKAIEAAVKKLGALAPRGAGRSGADMSGGTGGGPSIDDQIAAAEKARDFRTVIALKRQKAAQN